MKLNFTVDLQHCFMCGMKKFIIMNEKENRKNYEQVW